MALLGELLRFMNFLISFFQEILSHSILLLGLLLLVLVVSLFLSLPTIGVIAQPCPSHGCGDILHFFHHDGGDRIVREFHCYKYYRMHRSLTLTYRLVRLCSSIKPTPPQQSLASPPIEFEKALTANQHTAFIFSQSQQSKHTYIPTEHLKPYLHTPTTPTQKRIRSKMKNQWTLCFMIALFFYMSSDDIMPGTWYSENMYFDFHDKYRHKLMKQMKETGTVSQKYTKRIQQDKEKSQSI